MITEGSARLNARVVKVGIIIWSGPLLPENCKRTCMNGHHGRTRRVYSNACQQLRVQLCAKAQCYASLFLSFALLQHLSQRANYSFHKLKTVIFENPGHFNKIYCCSKGISNHLDDFFRSISQVHCSYNRFLAPCHFNNCPAFLKFFFTVTGSVHVTCLSLHRATHSNQRLKDSKGKKFRVD